MGVNLTGGYYDAGDNIKFNFPMAFTTTMLSWSTFEYGEQMGPELQNARVSIRWATNYLLKCATATPGKLYVGVGDPNADHKCWERPEDMDTPRTVYSQALVNNDNNFEQYKQEAESFICKILPNTPSSSTHYPQGGLMYKLPQSNLQHVTAITFLLTTYAKYMKATQHSFDCGNSVTVVPDALISLSKQQVDYILGDNPIKMSYMVRFGPSFLMRIHHRASSLPSRGLLSKPFNCIEGFQFYHTENPNPNLLAGAIVGGPDENDAYPDKRDEYIHSEPATYINAAFVGPLAYFGSGGSA
ncbi:hypothetical protein Bca52824_024672 [Brassica carinata]|uniref:Endoglucanase n=1 Tax=Brassica carinata TaxID=52824 RepID=A0A8X7VKL8_BRACI|nr:hypothetical protein Bca52824_024672 [Brassica carinata]